MIRLLAFVLVVACGASEPAPRAPAPITSAGEGETPPSPDRADDRAPETTPAEVTVVERWSCDRTLHPLVDFHRATLELREDASFELDHTNTTPEAGWTSYVQGTWARAATGTVVLTPVAARRTRWIGDGHRHDHGEDVPYRETIEVISTAPWRLTPRVDPAHGATLRIDELSTSVYRVAAGDQAPPCDDVAPR